MNPAGIIQEKVEQCIEATGEHPEILIIGWEFLARLLWTQPISATETMRTIRFYMNMEVVCVPIRDMVLVTFRDQLKVMKWSAR